MAGQDEPNARFPGQRSSRRTSVRSSSTPSRRRSRSALRSTASSLSLACWKAGGPRRRSTPTPELAKLLRLERSGLPVKAQAAEGELTLAREERVARLTRTTSGRSSPPTTGSLTTVTSGRSRRRMRSPRRTTNLPRARPPDHRDLGRSVQTGRADRSRRRRPLDDDERVLRHRRRSQPRQTMSGAEP